MDSKKRGLLKTPLKNGGTALCVAHGHVKHRLRAWVHSESSFKNLEKTKREELVENIVDMCKHVHAKAKYIGGGSYGQVFEELGIAVKFMPILEKDDLREYKGEVAYTKLAGIKKIGARMFDHFVVKIRAPMFYMPVKINGSNHDVGVIVMELGLHTLDYFKIKSRIKKVEQASETLIDRMLSAGIYCADLKPGNTVIINNQLRLIDFGPQFCELNLSVPKRIQNKLSLALKCLFSFNFAYRNVTFYRKFADKACSNLVVVNIMSGIWTGSNKDLTSTQVKKLKAFILTIKQMFDHYVLHSVPQKILDMPDILSFWKAVNVHYHGNIPLKQSNSKKSKSKKSRLSTIREARPFSIRNVCP